ncbi:BadM/Rrf2 family transcriptional regulator [Halopolyspora algeriensis]|uniref:BadM/Rrf2 family transcriptional regulator n=1 Tax=Halopolyspora algeriensis TaxID=1500506 RepID=A0A368VRY4_9ACTN|nr:Rrf2 family transcriptional regulator [Halopolyspora algeriensis]RCW44692.1 BadM/Rrf2 family transcriptional regulator [Halopolyspora algeriensis]TQM56050.1 BadM/Rrf2 family transcriptional regulator [Halopolyspora algeriensis]
MRISAKVDYAVRALVEIARADSGHPVSAEDVAAAQRIPRNFLQAVLSDLRRAGVVASRRGQSGGWVLARPAESISMADVIRATDGPLVSVHGLRPESVSYDPSVSVLQEVWIAVRSSLREVLEDVTVAQLVAGELPAEIAARTSETGVWESR